MSRPTQYDEVGADRHFFDGDGYLDKPAPDDRPVDMRVWKSPGPVASAFLQSSAPVSAIMGPIGGGKTITSFYKHLRFAMMQPPSLIDGVRRYKLCTVRETYRQLDKTTIPSWWKYFPKKVGKWQGGGGAPAVHLLEFNLPDGTRLEFWHDFVAIGDQTVEDAMKGYEPTAFYLNELDRQPDDVLTYADGRTGRYPDMDHGGPRWHGVTADFNAPNDENHAAKAFIFHRPEEWAFFKQPSGLAPNAENLANLTPGYYERQMIGKPDWYIRRMIRNELGYSREGQPVYPAYNDDYHCGGNVLAPVDGLPLILGGDGGRTPAVTIGQRLPNGQHRVLGELAAGWVDGQWTDARMGAAQFGPLLKQKIGKEYPRWASGEWRIAAVGDPSGANAGEADDNVTWMTEMERATGWSWQPAPSPSTRVNAWAPRFEAVDRALAATVPGPGGVEPAYLLSAACKVLRQGFASGYMFAKTKVAGLDESAERPAKNRYSHPHDAEQYRMLLANDELSIDLAMDAAARRPVQIQAITDENPTGGYSSGGGQLYAEMD